MEDTLRYFFSTIFQGIAAILTLGAMFYMNYNEKTKTRIVELIHQTNRIYSPSNSEASQIALKTNLIVAMRDSFLSSKKDNPAYELHFQIVAEYNEINKKLEKIKVIMPSLIFQGVVLLMLSSFSLFGVGYSKEINDSLFIVGILVLIITSTFLKNLVTILRITTGIGALKLKDLFFIAKTNNQK